MSEQSWGTEISMQMMRPAMLSVFSRAPGAQDGWNFSVHCTFHKKQSFHP
jgi:hypothetical protein